MTKMSGRAKRRKGVAAIAFVTCLPIVFCSEPAHSKVGESLSLPDLVNEATASYPAVLAQKNTVEAGRANVRSAWWQFFPSPSVALENSRGKTATTLQLTQPIWTGGRLSADLDVAKGQLSTSRWGVTETQYNVALRVVEYYQAYTSAILSLEVYDKYITNLKNFNAMMRRRVKRGYSAEVDAQLVSSRISQAKNVRTNLQMSRDTALESLSSLIGRTLSASNIEMFNSGDQYLLDVAISDEDFTQRAIEYSPELRRLDGQIFVARAQVDQAKSAVWPTLFLRAQHQVYNNYGLEDESQVVFGVQFSLGGGLSAVESVRSALALEGQAKNSRDAYRSELAAEIKRNLEALRSSRSLVDELSGNRTTQTEIYESYVRLFLVGKRTWLDVLNIMRERADVDRSLAESRASEYAALFRLRLNVGDFVWKP